MDASQVEWVTVVAYENARGCPQPMAAVRA
ncbi:Secreted hypothetical protein [Micromonospora lupini str. Lupac 08]|uniref:Uncharacterized protein n=1 Tax=Micromonospora lupini str. Lupac 08 TaxID=1150864 RepID=I0L4S9_9ACTN|nr:Secreted hypothetical protein [Micromonospora lupini str. Lupac 08]